jgi:hypothetical protein
MRSNSNYWGPLLVGIILIVSGCLQPNSSKDGDLETFGAESDTSATLEINVLKESEQISKEIETETISSEPREKKEIKAKIFTSEPFLVFEDGIGEKDYTSQVKALKFTVDHSDYNSRFKVEDFKMKKSKLLEIDHANNTGCQFTSEPGRKNVFSLNNETRKSLIEDDGVENNESLSEDYFFGPERSIKPFVCDFTLKKPSEALEKGNIAVSLAVNYTKLS